MEFQDVLLKKEIKVIVLHLMDFIHLRLNQFLKDASLHVINVGTETFFKLCFYLILYTEIIVIKWLSNI